MNANIEALQTIPYQIINDKALANQDYLFKLIIIGDTGTSNISLIKSNISKKDLTDNNVYIGVGKSCLLARVMDNEFKVEH